MSLFPWSDMFNATLTGRRFPFLGVAGDTGAVNRAGGIRTHGLHVPNVALYQAEPQPVKKKRRLDRPKGEVNLGFPRFLDRCRSHLTKLQIPPITSHEEIGIPVMMLSTASIVVRFGSMSSATVLPRRSTMIRSTT